VLLSTSRLFPLTATSFGTGQLVADALDAGCDELVIAVGGSACTDGGAGMLQALGHEINAQALTVMLQQIIAKDRAGGWRKIKREL